MTQWALEFLFTFNSMLYGMFSSYLLGHEHAVADDSYLVQALRQVPPYAQYALVLIVLVLVGTPPRVWREHANALWRTLNVNRRQVANEATARRIDILYDHVNRLFEYADEYDRLLGVQRDNEVQPISVEERLAQFSQTLNRNLEAVQVTNSRQIDNLRNEGIERFRDAYEEMMRLFAVALNHADRHPAAGIV